MQATRHMEKRLQVTYGDQPKWNLWERINIFFYSRTSTRTKNDLIFWLPRVKPSAIISAMRLGQRRNVKYQRSRFWDHIVVENLCQKNSMNTLNVKELSVEVTFSGNRADCA